MQADAVCGSMSIQTARAPARAMGALDDMQENASVSTSSPDLTPASFRASDNALVMVSVLTTCGRPIRCAMRSWKRSTKGPLAICPVPSIWRAACSMAGVAAALNSAMDDVRIVLSLDEARRRCAPGLRP